MNERERVQHTYLQCLETVRAADLAPEVQISLLAMTAATVGSVRGQCEREEPFAPLFPVLTDDGLKWCCSHEPRHCSGIVTGS